MRFISNLAKKIPNPFRSSRGEPPIIEKDLYEKRKITPWARERLDQEYIKKLLADPEAHGISSLDSNTMRSWSERGQLEKALKIYEETQKPLEKYVSEKAINHIAARYTHYSPRLDAELLHLNPGGEELAVKQSTTFAHALFEAKAPAEAIYDYFKQVNRYLGSNPELAQNYMALTNTEGVSIAGLLENSTLSERYQGLFGWVQTDFRNLFPASRAANPGLVVDTHTGSVHSSVDRSLVKLAKLYDPSLSPTSDRTIRVNQTDAWKQKINADFTQLEAVVSHFTGDEDLVREFLEPTFGVRDTEEDKQKAVRRFQFQARAALRMIEGLKQPRYGRTYTIASNEAVGCGLTPREIVTIAFKSLEDRRQWINPEQEAQHLISFIENLYKAQRGYNIDRYGDDEWQSHGTEEDNNKCPGGMVNQVVSGLSDHKSVEIKIIDTVTMQGPVSVKLPEILNQLAQDKTQKDQILLWLQNGTMSGELRSNLIQKLKEHAGLLKEFSADEIERFAGPVLSLMNTEKLFQDLQEKYPATFSDLQASLDPKKLLTTFVFDKGTEETDGKGYIAYLEDLYGKNPDQARQLMQTLAESDLKDRKNLSLINFLGSSVNQEFTKAFKEIFKTKLNSFEQPRRDRFFLSAAKAGYTWLAKTAFEAGADINAANPDDNSMTALHYAAAAGDAPLAIFLLSEMSAEAIGARDKYGLTALHEAASFGSTEVVKLLLDKMSADAIDAKSVDGWTALHRAALLGHIGVVRLLLDKMSDKAINAENKSGQTALHEAAEYGRTEVVRLLLDKMSADAIDARNEYGKTALHEAALKGKTEVVRLLLDKMSADAIDARDKDNGFTALHKAADNGHTEVVRLLLDKMSDKAIKAMSTHSQAALHLASLKNHSSIVELIKAKSRR